MEVLIITNIHKTKINLLYIEKKQVDKCNIQDEIKYGNILNYEALNKECIFFGYNVLTNYTNIEEKYNQFIKDIPENSTIFVSKLRSMKLSFHKETKLYFADDIIFDKLDDLVKYTKKLNIIGIILMDLNITI